MSVFCPLCQVPAAQVLSKFTVTAKKDGENDVGALLVYQCPAAHIFFLRGADVSESQLGSDFVYRVLPRA
jgi:hypothetical protein